LTHSLYRNTYGIINDITTKSIYWYQIKIADIQEKGWTLAALADELEISLSALEKWKAGATYPRNSKAVMLLLERIEHRNRIPKRRRYKPGRRTQG